MIEIKKIAVACLMMIMCALHGGAQGGELQKALGSLNKAEAKSDSTLKPTTPATKSETKKPTQVADSTAKPVSSDLKGSVTFHADSSIVSLEKGKRGFKEIKGYRIQIVLGDAELVKKERNNYLALKLPYSAYMKQIVPEYALQIGDFHTRMEMEKHLEKIKVHYPKAFPVVEVIEPRKFGK